MNGDDVRDWETTGSGLGCLVPHASRLDPAGEIGDRYMIELDEAKAYRFQWPVRMASHLGRRSMR